MNTRPLRIGLLMHSLNPRGGVVHTLELADALSALGHAVTVFTAGLPGQRLFRDTAARLSVAELVPMSAGLPTQVRARMDAMARHLRATDLDAFDVLHSQDSITANALADLRDEGRLPGFVRTIHHLDAFDDPQLSAWQARGVRQASMLLCVSAVWQDVLARDWGRRAERVGNGVNLRRYVPATGTDQREADAGVVAKLGIRPDAPYWLAVGGIEARKNTTRLLQAFVRMMDVVPASQLVIAGGASLLEHGDARREFEAVRCAHGLAPGQAHAHRLILTGPLPDATLPPLYRLATALAMPSVKEGFGLVAIEAMACGTPAIVSRIAPFTEHLQPADAFWVDPLDADDIANALRLSLYPGRHAQVARTARAVAARFDWMASARRHVELYAQHLAHHLPCHA